MRLLALNGPDDYSLSEFFGDNIPPYAVLSHTWRPDNSEVTYQDILAGTARSKAGYDKIQFCAEIATGHGLKYFWVDTCCIDKMNAVELQEAITSMFRWYRGAARCYVYLSDLSVDGSIPHKNLLESSFRASRWFKRGWTLQELLAPASVEFVSREGKRVGDKTSLESQIHDVTGIDVMALRGAPLSQFDIDERFKWAEGRQTTREEDWAYALQGIFDVSLPIMYGEGRDRAVARLKREVNDTSKYATAASWHEGKAVVDLSLLPTNFHQDARWIVPFDRNLRFTGRESQLVDIEKRLFQGGQTSKVAVTGLGGVGKTQMVLELAYRTKQKHRGCAVIWIPATNMEALHKTYRDIAQQLEISDADEPSADVKKLLQNYLSKESSGQWLLVIDNADDINMWISKSSSSSDQEYGGLISYLPRSKQGSIVFTTRDRKTAIKLAPHNVVELEEMNAETASQLLQKCLIHQDLVADNKVAENLLEELTYLPLAIVQAAAYINENGITIQDYQSLLADQEEEVIDLLSEEFSDEWRYTSVKNPVATTWLISFEQLQQRDSAAADYLAFMACIEPKDIPLSLLPEGRTRNERIKAIGTLHAYSFVTQRPADHSLDLHRLVHLATRNWLRKENLLAHWTEKVIERLNEVFPSDEDHKNRSLWRVYLPHVRYAIESDLVDREWKTRTTLMWRYGMCLYEDGRWTEAEAPITQYLDIEKKLLGEDHPDTLISMANLSLIYAEQGRWQAAEELGVHVMETRKKILGEEHLQTLNSMSNAAFIYAKQGRWREAEELGYKVMETRRKVLGEEHPHTLVSMNNLAFVYDEQGRWSAAEDLGFQVLEVRRHGCTLNRSDLKRRKSCRRRYLKSPKTCWAWSIRLRSQA